MAKYCSIKKNSPVDEAERKIKSQKDWESKAGEIIAQVVKDLRLDANDEKEIREKFGLKNSSPRKFCSIKKNDKGADLYEVGDEIFIKGKDHQKGETSTWRMYQIRFKEPDFYGGDDGWWAKIIGRK